MFESSSHISGRLMSIDDPSLGGTAGMKLVLSSQKLGCKPRLSPLHSCASGSEKPKLQVRSSTLVVEFTVLSSGFFKTPREGSSSVNRPSQPVDTASQFEDGAGVVESPLPRIMPEALGDRESLRH